MPIYKDFRYTEREDYIILRAYCGDDTEVIVPDLINGKPVVEITPGAFVPEMDSNYYPIHDDKKHCSKRIRSITLPDTVLRLDRAFSGCFELEEIILPSNVELLGNDNFHLCYALKAIYVSEMNESYTSRKGILYSKDGTKLLRCPSSFPLWDKQYLDGVLEIGPSAFEFCSFLLEIAIPETLLKIEDFAFANCHNLANIQLHENVHLSGNGHFWCCKVLDNVIYYNTEGIIPRNEFYSCENLKSIDIRSKARIIGYGAFSATALVSFTVPKGNTTISASAFMHCYSLKSVEIPRSTNRIHESAFSHCGKKYYSDEQLADIRLCFGMNPATTFIVVPGSKAEAFCIRNGYKVVHIQK